MRVLAFLLLLVFLLPAPVRAESGWVDDKLYVPIRSGQGNQYRIVHRGLPSGTRLEILEWPEEAEWVKVRYKEVEGYIGAQYVSRAPTAAIKLKQLQQRYEQTREKLEQVQQQLSEVTSERNQLAETKKNLEEQLSSAQDKAEHLQEVAADPIRLDKANRELNEKLSLLRTELDQVKAENNMLSSENTSRKWAMGAGILILGGILGWIFKSRGRKGNSNWV